MPTVNRPSESLSMLASCLPSSAPLPRYGAMTIAVVSRMRLVTAAAAASTGTGSKLS